MSLAPERAPSPSLNVNLSSNNPFRNRAASPVSPSSMLPSPQSPSSKLRPLSTNPFIDVFDEPPATEQTRPRSRDPTMASSNRGSKGTNGRTSGISGNAVELFENLTLSRKPTNDENTPLMTSSRANPQPSHRPSRSQEEDGNRRNASPLKPGRGPPRDFGRDRERRRPRRNSDSSVRSSRLLEPEDRRRERRLRRVDPFSSKPKKPNHHLDLIDKLDVTSIYGTGLFHHDGPFDACNPHRNRKKDHRAPMQAFPKDSANNAIGGSGPVNKVYDPSQFMGHSNNEAFTDFSKSGIDTSAYSAYEPRYRQGASAGPVQPFNPTARVDPIHGDESLGLGTSTFLEGTPASRKAIQRRESESEVIQVRPAGLQRKKSLVQKIRGINGSRPNGPPGPPGPSRRVISPEPRNEIGSAVAGNPPRALSAGGLAKANQSTNPFFNEYDAAYDQKSKTIAVAQEEKLSVIRRDTAEERRPPNLERRTTTDNAPSDPNKSAGGFLSRVKSLKGGKRSRPERVEA